LDVLCQILIRQSSVETPHAMVEALNKKELVILGSGMSLALPAFFCTCATCEAVRKDPSQRRTRASAALIGQEITLIDAGPDMGWQLEREGIRRVDRIFITHWHHDHVLGLGPLAEAAEYAGWPPVHIYVPREVISHFDKELSYIRRNIVLHPTTPAQVIDLPDAKWEIVKTNHTEHSVGFIVESARRFAYLVDSYIPPPETIERLRSLDLLILEATMDHLDTEWKHFTLEQAIDFWKRIGAPECILTHLSCHAWMNGRLTSGFAPEERKEFELKHPGLTVAYDGLRIGLDKVNHEPE